MDRRITELPEEVEPAQVELTAEDQEELLTDCHQFLEKVLDRKNPLWLQTEGLKLLQRLSEGLSWYRIH